MFFLAFSGANFALKVVKLGGEINLGMFLIQMNKKKNKNCKHLPLEVTKSENTRWVAVTPLHLDFDVLP